MSALGAVAARTQQLQVIGVIRAAFGFGQDVIDLHHAEREMRAAARAYAFLFAIKLVAMRAVVRQIA